MTPEQIGLEHGDQSERLYIGVTLALGASMQAAMANAEMIGSIRMDHGAVVVVTPRATGQVA